MQNLSYYQLFSSYTLLIDIFNQLKVRSMIVNEDTGEISIFYRDPDIEPLTITDGTYSGETTR
jgi:hypothetical protein